MTMEEMLQPFSDLQGAGSTVAPGRVEGRSLSAAPLPGSCLTARVTPPLQRPAPSLPAYPACSVRRHAFASPHAPPSPPLAPPLLPSAPPRPPPLDVAEAAPAMLAGPRSSRRPGAGRCRP